MNTTDFTLIVLTTLSGPVFILAMRWFRDDADLRRARAEREASENERTRARLAIEAGDAAARALTELERARYMTDEERMHEARYAATLLAPTVSVTILDAAIRAGMARVRRERACAEELSRLRQRLVDRTVS